MAHMLETRLRRARKSGRRGGVAGVWLAACKDLLATVVSEARRGRRKIKRDKEREGSMGALVQDLRYALRRLGRTPLFTLGALAIMAVAIGANTAAFTVVNQVLLKPPPFAEPDRVVNVYQDSDEGEPNSTSFPAYRDMAAMTGIFQAAGATSPDGATLDTEEGSGPVAIEYTTAGFMDAVGMTPVRGRWFDAEMDHVGAGNYAVVSHHTWRNRFASDPEMVGRVLRMNGEPVTIIGVGPEGFNGIGGFMVTDFWLSISSVGLGGDYRVANLDRRQDHWYDVKARLAPGVSVAQAQEAMNALALRLAEAYPDLNRGRDITVFPTRDIRLHPDADGDLLPVAVILMSVVALILILASSNLGGLLLVRGVTRNQEVAVRRAMGAAPGRVARLFLGEAFLLSLTGGGLGILLAQWLLGLFGALPLDLPLGGEMDLSMDGRVLLFTLALMVATGIFFGWAPAAQSMASSLTSSLKEDRRTSGGRRLGRFRNLMVSVQVAVSLILVLGAGLLVRSLASYYQVDPGVDVERLAILRTDFTPLGVTPEERGVLLDQVTERLGSLPGVESVAATTRLPLSGGGSSTTTVEGYDPPSGTGSVELDWSVVSLEYFRTVGMEVVEGRNFTRDDREAPGWGPYIVNQAAADRFWGGVDPVGRRMRPQSEADLWNPVVGVVSTTKVERLDEPPTPIMYWIMPETGLTAPYILVRTAGEPEAILGAIRSQLQAVDPRLPVVQLRTMASLVADSMATPRMVATVLGIFGALALLLASLGIYTIVAFSVAGRMPEIGIRMALGARGSRVVRGVMGEMGVTVGMGLAGGALLAVLVFPRIQGMIYGAELLSAGTLVPAVLILVATVALASWIPARRAARVDPVEALRGE